MNGYSIWVMEYAWVANYHLSGLIYGAHNQGHRKLPYCYILIKGQGQTALVDVGYNHKAYGEVLANMYGVENWHSPRTVLAECGVLPEDVSNIFITHAHFDHMGTPTGRIRPGHARTRAGERAGLAQETLPLPPAPRDTA